MKYEPSTQKVLHDHFGLTPDDLAKALGIAQSSNPGAYVDIFCEDSTTEGFSMQDGILTSPSLDQSYGVGVYVVIGDKEGHAYADDVTAENLFLAARTASTIAKYGKHQDAVHVGAVGSPHNLYPVGLAPTDAALLEKIALMRNCDAEARKEDPRVKRVISTLGVQFKTVVIANSINGGTLVHDQQPMVRLKVNCIAVDEHGHSEMGSSGGGQRDEFGFLLADNFWGKHARLAARQAADKLTAAPAPAGQKAVVLGAGWPGVLVHEAVGHGLEADFNRTKNSAFSGRIGERVAAPGVTIIDNGTLSRRRGSLNMDDQGIPTTETVLIENGILKCYLQDYKNARLMGAAFTGNGRRQSYRHKPIPRMTNTFMGPGPHEVAEMIKAVHDGLYAVEFGGGQVDIVNGKFVFELAMAYEIKGGKLGRAIRGATLIGDGPTAMTKIKMVGNEEELLDAGIGICGKNGQSVPVCVGMPSCLIMDVTVGGTGE